MNREYSKYSSQDPVGTRLVDELPLLVEDISGYQDHMRQIGTHLILAIEDELRSNPSGEICVVCTVEDADFLARGVIERLEHIGLGNRTRLLCLWNENIHESDFRLSPIIKQYKEDFEKKDPVFIIVKSIISGACVVKTNLTRALSQADPTKIYVVAPVILQGAEERLEREFPTDVSSKFEFVWFAADKQKKGDSVIPGIGGPVYELLGFKDSEDKNKYLPIIVKERRKMLFGATLA
ncbi:MAG: hypothetical protein ACMG51_04710 [Ginsengibacter sp.]